MDSYHKFSFKIPRYLIVVSAEPCSVGEVSLIKQLATSLCVARSHDKHPPSSSCSPSNDVHSVTHPSLWLSAVAPGYHQDAESSGSGEGLFKTGWRRVGGQESASSGQRDQEAFATLQQKFDKTRSEMDGLPVAKLREYTGMLASELDKIADELPTGGFLMDVVWLMPTSTDFPILERADAFLFSVLRRLEVWHGAKVTLVVGRGLSSEDHPLTNWRTFIDCRVVTLGGSEGGEEVRPDRILATSSSLAWKGQVKYISSRGTAFPPWPGFSLHRLEEGDPRAEPFIEILTACGESGQEVAGSSETADEASGGQESADETHSDATHGSHMPKYVVNDTLEFIHLANLHEIPSWFILPGKFELRLKDRERQQRFSRSCFWLHYLTHRLPGDGQGAIFQLSCLELDGPAPPARAEGLSTEVWTRGMTSDPFNPPVPSVQLKGRKHTFFFLVHGDRRGRCIAVPLVSPFMLNGAAHALLARQETDDDTNSERVDAQAARQVLDSLPTVNGRQLKEDEENLAKMQLEALVMMIEKIREEGLQITMSPSVIIFLFNYMRKVYYDGYSIDDVASPSPSSASSPSHGPASGLVATEPGAAEQRASTAQQEGEGTGEHAQTQEGPSSRQRRRRRGGGGTEEEAGGETARDGSSDGARAGGTTERTILRNIPTELDQSPSQWLERQVLQNRESIANRLRRLRSEDMMLGGISVPPPDSNIITLSAKEFRSHFKPSGHPKRDDLVLGQPALARQSPRTRAATAGGHHSNGAPSIQELMQKDFQTSLKLKYHGINYCLETPDSQSQDQRLVRLQQRCVRREMSCTFTPSHQPTQARPTLAIRSKRKLSASPKSQHKAKIRKLSASATKKKSSNSTRHGTPRKRGMSSRKSTTPLKARGSTSRVATTPRKARGTTPRTITTPRSSKKRPRSSTMGGLTPKRLKPSTPRKSKPPEDIATPRRSARKLAREQQQSSSAVATAPPPHPPSSSRARPAPSSSSSPSGSSRKASEKTNDPKPAKSRSSSESRSEKHKRKLRSIVEETLKSRGIDSSHVCFKSCVTRLYTQTKMFVKDLKTSKGLYDEMRKIAQANAEFVISFELKRVAPKS